MFLSHFVKSVKEKINFQRGADFSRNFGPEPDRFSGCVSGKSPDRESLAHFSDRKNMGAFPPFLPKKIAHPIREPAFSGKRSPLSRGN